VPLPWVIKKPFLNAFLRDVHHYLFDVTFAPLGKQPVPIQQTIRRRFVEHLQTVASRPHVVVSHSMGTVIAYDCLKRVAACPAIDALITIGSPLGLDEIQEKLQPGWTRADGFPHERVAEWANYYDRLDPVCAFDPVLADDFFRDGKKAVNDVEVQNSGAWRHSSGKYLRQPGLTAVLRRMLKAKK
jgi:pimeloyl-ACP methyl ester carboxylesterase